MSHLSLRALLLAIASTATDACSAYIAGKHATVDGTVMVSHSDDGAGASDPRVSFVPAADHPKGAMRPILPDLEDYPRFVGHGRGSTYEPLDGQAKTEAIGEIPQVEHTLAYYDSNYAIMNECTSRWPLGP